MIAATKALLPATARWTACFTLAAGLHVAGALALLTHWSARDETPAGGAVVLVELMPVIAATTPIQFNLPPAPARVDSAGDANPTDKPVEADRPDPAPEPVERTEEKQPRPEQTAAIVQEPDPPAAIPELPAMPKPRPPEPGTEPPAASKRTQASLASAPSAAERQATRQTAHANGVTQNPDALPSWRARLSAQLERNKRYPPAARQRGEQGVAQLAFTVGHDGSVHGARILRSSGSDLLDRETLAMIARAQPLPPPPPELGQRSVAIVVPIRYTVR